MKLRTVPLIAILAILLVTTASANRIYSSLPDTAIIQPNVTWTKTFELFSTDFEPPYKWSVQPVGEAPIGKFELPEYHFGRFYFTPATTDTGKLYSFKATITDNRGIHESSQFFVQVDNRFPSIIEIERTHNSLQGQHEYVSITKTTGTLVANSFNLKICFNGDGLRFDTLILSDTLTKLGWTCNLSRARTASFGPLKLPAACIQVQAYSPHREITALPNIGFLTIKFLVTNDRMFACQFIPIHFAWSDCRDNTFMSSNADTMFSCLNVVDFEWRNEIDKARGEDCSGQSATSLTGPCRNHCNTVRNLTDVPNIVFKNGGIDLVCGGGNFEPPGDLNLNGISYEIADFELISRWLAFGDSILDINPAVREAQFAASDANQDGTTASVADMVYLARVIVGDAVPFPKLRPYQEVTLCEKSHDTLFVESNDSITGILILFKADEKASFENLSNIEMITGRHGSLTTLLFKPSLKDLQGHISSGRSPLVRIRGKSEIQSIEISDYNGSIMNVRK